MLSNNFIKLFSSCKISSTLCNSNISRSLLPFIASNQPIRSFNIASIRSPKPNDGRHNYRYEVHYPKDGKYTIEHLPMTRRGGRDPVTGRIVNGTWGGGRKTKYRWIDFDRSGPIKPNEFKHEKVIEVQYDPNRSAFIALVCGGSHMRYIIATTSMKAGDVIRSSSYIPEIPVRAVEGDSYPVGALATGTKICHLERRPGESAKVLIAAGTQGVITRKLPDNKVLITLPNKHQIAVKEECMCVAGQVSNENNDKHHIGSAQRLRWLGYRPRSGLWQRKDGYCGRKIRKPPPIKHYDEEIKEKKYLMLHCPSEEPRKQFIPKTDRKS